jgi:CxxC motif-containing protein (DUF1111 family)
MRLAAKAFGGVALIVALSGAKGSATTQLGDPFPGLSAADQKRFDDGLDQFNEVETVADGLGPVFNENSCAVCHTTPAVGGSGARVETRFGTITAGVFDPLTSFGGSLIQSQGIGLVQDCNFVGETVPKPPATLVAGRRTIPLFGLGLVDAVPEQTFRDLATTELTDPDGAVGRVAVVTDPSTGLPAVGRFGWKAQVPSLFVFSGDAYLNEMGITSPVFPMENCPQGDCTLLRCDPVADPEDKGGADVARFTDFMTLLAPPPQGSITGQARAGENVFRLIGCTSCHQPTLTTGSSPFAQLDHVTFQPYSDFLLHDMGALADQIAQGAAGQTEMRTAPLWGVSAQKSFLHDGRATTLTDAILAHAGQGQAARDRFFGLTNPRKQQLLAFLSAL